MAPSSNHRPKQFVVDRNHNSFLHDGQTSLPVSFIMPDHIAKVAFAYLPDPGRPSPYSVPANAANRS